MTRKIIAIACLLVLILPLSLWIHSKGAVSDRAGCQNIDSDAVPIFTYSSGFFNEPFSLGISSPRSSSPILYTLDGSYPDPDSQSTVVYTGPIKINDRSSEPNRLSLIETSVAPFFEVTGGYRPVTAMPSIPVQKGTVVRARTEYGAEAVATFFVGSSLIRRKLPVVSLILNEEFLFDDEVGIYVPGALFAEYVKSGEFDPGANVNRATPANYNQAGRKWERPPREKIEKAVIFEYFEPGGRHALQQSIGIRIHGVASRRYSQKTLRLYARSDYGEPYFTYDFFNQGGNAQHRRLLLRNFGQGWGNALIQDTLVSQVVSDFNAESQSSQLVILFINGEYWGIHDLRERYDQHYLSVKHGIPLKKVEISNSSSDFLEGDGETFFAAIQVLEQSSHVTDGVVAEVESLLDLDSLFDLLITHIFFANEDFAAGNIRLWRHRRPPEEIENPLHDGRWRWMLFDFDLIGGAGRGRFDVNYNLFDSGRRGRHLPYRTERERRRDYPFLFHRLMENEAVRTRFLSRFHYRMENALSPEKTGRELRRLASLLESEIEHHIERWNPGKSRSRHALSSVKQWFDMIDNLERFLKNRPDIQKEQLDELFVSYPPRPDF